MGKFVIRRRRNGEYQFDLIADNGQIILASEGYITLDACKNGIESVKKNAPILARYDKLISSNGRYYFNLKASNGQIIGTSASYDSLPDRDESLEGVMSEVISASIEES